MKLRSVPCLVVTCCSLIGIRPAVAQNVDEHGRFAFGTVSFTPSVLFVAGHDTDLIRTPEGAGGSEFYEVAQVESWWRTGRVRATGAGAVEYQRHPGQPKNTVWNNTADFEMSTVSGRIRPSFTFSRHDHYAPPTDFSGFEFGIKSRRVETSGEIRLAALVGARTSLVGMGRSNLTSYDADARFQGVSLQQSLNRTGTWAGLSLEHTITGQTTVFEVAETGQDRFRRDPIRDGRNVRIGGGVRMKATALIGGTAFVGRRVFKSRTQPGADFAGLTWQANLSFARPRFVALVDTQRDLFVSYNTLLGRYVARGASAYLSAHVSSRIDAYLAATAFRLNYTVGADAPASRYDSAGTGVIYRFGRFTLVGVTGEWYRQRGAGAYRGRRLTTYLQYGGGRIRRLDRPLPGER